MEEIYPPLRIARGDPAAGAENGTATQQQQAEYLFELAPLGPGDLLSRCREGPGNWWGEGTEDLRVDAKGRVVLVDPEIYYEVREGKSGGRYDILLCLYALSNRLVQMQPSCSETTWY